jgi:uncharacterized protein YdaU (DUF1376 family)
MTKDPAFLLYSSDFLTGTMFMTNEQVGKYIRLLCVQHQKGHLNEKDMLNICSTYDEDVFKKFSKDENGLYYNKRLESETQKRLAYSESRRQNRLKGKNICKSYVPHMENENENENIDSIIETIPIVEEGKPKKEKPAKVEIDLNPFQDADLNENWKDWVGFRKEIKEDLTPIAAKKQINFLNKYHPEEAISIIDRSIQNKWKGLFEPEQRSMISKVSTVADKLKNLS